MVNNDRMVEMLYLMLKIRRVEERLMEDFGAGKIPGFIHVSIGQEAVPVGVCTCLEKSDIIFSNHRGHGHAISKGVDLKKFMAEIYGRKDGLCKGKSGSMHIASKEDGVYGSNGIVGGGLPISLGTAFASVYKGERKVTVCFFGDGASNQGTFHETLNIAALWNLPVIFCCENNGWAQFTPQTKYLKVKDISKRSEAYGMFGITVDGNDVLKVREATEKAVERARKGEGPSLLEFKTFRWFGHYVGDQQKYRSSEEINKVRERDPIKIFEEYLIRNSIIKERDISLLEQKLQKEIDEAVKFAESCQIGDKSELFKDVYAEE